LIDDAIRALRNNETRVTYEAKGTAGRLLTESKVTYPAELVAAFKGLFGAGRTYDFQLHYVTTQTSTAGGGLLGSETINPSVTSFGEWSALSALFDEVKGISSTFDWLTLLSPDQAGVTVGDMVVAFDETLLASSAPSSVLSVFRLAESRTFVSQMGSAGSGRHRQNRRFVPRAYAPTSTPAGITPFMGLCGAWVFGNSGLFPVSTAVATTYMVVHARFRCRA
jgi:hypothetical protein